jgi:hypothetical protein
VRVGFWCTVSIFSLFFISHLLGCGLKSITNVFSF